MVDAQTEDPGTLWLVPADGDPELASRFLADARLLAGLDHPSLPSVLAVGEAPEGAYVVTEAPPGRSLAAVLDSRLPPGQAIRMLADVAGALDVAHAAGLLHRALRPANILVGEWLMVRATLSNFALGRPSGEAADDEQAPYASPEELRGETPGPPAGPVRRSRCGSRMDGRGRQWCRGWVI